jgi:hypothetical protein
MNSVIVQYKYFDRSWEHWKELGPFQSCEEAFQHLLDRWKKNGRCKKFHMNNSGVMEVSLHDKRLIEIRFFDTINKKVLIRGESPWAIGLNEAMKCQ